MTLWSFPLNSAIFLAKAQSPSRRSHIGRGTPINAILAQGSQPAEACIPSPPRKSRRLRPPGLRNEKSAARFCQICSFVSHILSIFLYRFTVKRFQPSLA
jgi:hypothetical protein